MFAIYVEYHTEDGNTSDYAIGLTRNECYDILEGYGIDWRDVFYEAGGEFDTAEGVSAFLSDEMHHIG